MSTQSILYQARVLLGDTNSSSYWKQDWEVNDAITAAVPEVEIDYPQGYSVTVSGEGSITPTPDGVTKKLVAYKTAIILRQGEEASSSRDSIYVKDGDTVIDTTKGGSNKSKSLDSLIQRYNDLIDDLLINGEITDPRGYRINVYKVETL